MSIRPAFRRAVDAIAFEPAGGAVGVENMLAAGRKLVFECLGSL